MLMYCALVVAVFSVISILLAHYYVSDNNDFDFNIICLIVVLFSGIVSYVLTTLIS